MYDKLAECKIHFVSLLALGDLATPYNPYACTVQYIYTLVPSDI